MPNHYVTKFKKIGAISCTFHAFQALKRTKNAMGIAPIIGLCYIKIGNDINLYVRRYNDWCKFRSIFCAFKAMKRTTVQRNCFNHCTSSHKDRESSQSLCNKVQSLVQFRCFFCVFQALKRTKNATKLHQSLYFVT